MVRLYSWPCSEVREVYDALANAGGGENDGKGAGLKTRPHEE